MHAATQDEPANETFRTTTEVRLKTVDGTIISGLLMSWKMPNKTVTAVLLLLLAVGSDGDDESLQTRTADRCTNCLDHEEMKSLNIELIKASILNKLGMKQPPEFGSRLPPRVSTDLPPLQDIMHKYSNDHSSSSVFPHIPQKSHHLDATDDSASDLQSNEATGSSTNGYNGGDTYDDYHVKIHKLIAFAQPHPTTQKLQGHYPLYFTFSKQTSYQQITKAIMWLYKRRLDVVIDDPVVMIDVYRVDPSNMHQSIVTSIKSLVNTTEPGWVPIDLQRIRMSDWFMTTEGTNDLTLVVHAYYVNKNITHVRTPYVTDARKREDITEIPYLEVHTEDSHLSRPKRFVLGRDCVDNRCCRHPLVFDFEAVGWSWIISPKKIDAYYCSGECPLESRENSYRNHTFVQLTKRLGTGLCCAPRKLSDISILYQDGDLNFVYGMLPGMVVETCGCS